MSDPPPISVIAEATDRLRIRDEVIPIPGHLPINALCVFLDGQLVTHVSWQPEVPEFDSIPAEKVATMLRELTVALRATREVLLRRRAPYTAKAGDRVPFQYDGKTLWAIVQHDLENQAQPVVFFRYSNDPMIFIAPAVIFDAPGLDPRSLHGHP